MLSAIPILRVYYILLDKGRAFNEDSFEDSGVRFVFSVLQIYIQSYVH